MAKGAGSNRGTGGMITKLSAVSYIYDDGIDCYIVNGTNPEILYDVLDGKNCGTLFKGKAN